MTIIPLKQRDLFTRRWRKQLEPQKEVTSLHIPLVAMLRWCIKPTVLWRHCPNGEHRDKRTAAKLKAMGVLPGSADLEFFYSSHESGAGALDHSPFDLQCAHVDARLHVLFLELKLPGRKPTEQQAAFGLAMKCLGADYYIVQSIPEAIGILGAHGLIRPDVEVCGKRWAIE